MLIASSRIDIVNPSFVNVDTDITIIKQFIHNLKIVKTFEFSNEKINIYATRHRITKNCDTLIFLQLNKSHITAIISHNVKQLIDVGLNLKILAKGRSPNSKTKISSGCNTNKENPNKKNAINDKYGVVTTPTAIHKSEIAKIQTTFLLQRNMLFP